MRGQPDDLVMLDGVCDWSDGVDSIKTPTVASAINPNGISRNGLCWLINATVRDGGITQRAGWKLKGTIGFIPGTTLLFQGSTFYEPIDQSNPYIIAVINGHVYQIDPDFSYAPIDLSAAFGLFLPSGNPQAYFVQAEQYLVIQAGDEVTLPLFWNGATLVQSNGITGITVVGQPVAKQFQMVITTPWTQGVAAGDQSTAVFLNAPYPGNLGDNIQINNVPLGTLRGTFRVTTIAPLYIILTTIIPGLTNNLPAETVTSTLQNMTTMAGTPVTNDNVIIGVGGFVMPAVGGQSTFNLIAPYFGNVGDTFTLSSTDLSVNYGTFKVISFTAGGTLRVQNLTAGSVAAGTLILQATFNLTITAVRNFSQNWPVANNWVVPAPGGSVNLIGIRFGASFQGTLGDHLLVKDNNNGVTLGVFQCTASILPSGSSAGGIVLTTIASGQVGFQFGGGGSINATVVLPPNPSQDIVIGVGNWSVPPVGSRVFLQLLWNYTGTGTPTSYPGNVGDNVTLVSNVFPFNIGTFIVTQFDNLGGITLQTVSSNIVGTTFTTPIAGTITIVSPPSTTGTLINQIPAAKYMKYYMGRIFYDQNDVTNAGDIVGGPSGTSANNFVDSVLSVTENPIVLGGDGFKLPTQSGPITGYAVPNTVDASLGQGILLIGTRRAIYAMYVPVTRQDWISANSNNQPQIVQVQFRDGFVGQDSVVGVNGDVFYATWEPGVRSLLQATRLFSEPGNVPISANEKRILQFTNTDLLEFASGINFDNRLLMTALPMQTTSGVVHSAILPLDFTPISSVGAKHAPSWEGNLAGLQILKLMEQDFSGTDRGFAVVLSQNPNTPGAVDLWELTTGDRFESEGQPTESRVQWQIETPAFEFGDITALKKMVSAELWLDKIFGTVELQMEWRPDGDACWKMWHKWKVCVARNSDESPGNPLPYPTQFGEGFRQTQTLPAPPEQCVSMTGRPANILYQVQIRLTVKGYCRVRGIYVCAESVNRKMYQNLVC